MSDQPQVTNWCRMCVEKQKEIERLRGKCEKYATGIIARDRDFSKAISLLRRVGKFNHTRDQCSICEDYAGHKPDCELAEFLKGVSDES